jgi:hypothetical protein
MTFRTSTWIHLHGDAFTNKKILAAASVLTRGDVHKMVGHLGAFWLWCMEFAQEGDLGPLSDRAIAQAAGWPGSARRFVETLVTTGLLDADRKIHDWDAYAGRLIRKRQVDAARKRAEYNGTKRLGLRILERLEPPSSGLGWATSGDHAEDPAESPMEKAARVSWS